MSNNQTPLQYDDNSRFKDYIINNNIELQGEIKLLMKQVIELQNEISEKEDNEDKMEERMKYLKCLLINLNELKKEYKYITDKTDKKYKIISNYFLDFNILSIFNIVVVVTIIYNLVLNFKYNFNRFEQNYCYLNTNFVVIFKNTLISFWPLLVNIILICEIILIKYKKIKIIKSQIKIHDNQIQEKLQEIMKIEDSCLSLDNWIHEG